MPMVDRILTSDSVLCNDDRNPGNFGLSMEIETLRWIGTAPAFDCGPLRNAPT